MKFFRREAKETNVPFIAKQKPPDQNIYTLFLRFGWLELHDTF